MGINVDGSLGLILGLLDDLFGGRARIHLFDRATRVLIPAGVDEPNITAPGPLHRALEMKGVVVEHVGSALPAAWSASYRAWIPRGECHLIAARIEGGGEVVGVLSVVRNENTSVPVAEDRSIVGALAARLGRSAAVTLARASTSMDVRQPDADLPEAEPETEPETTEDRSDEDEAVAPIAVEPDIDIDLRPRSVPDPPESAVDADETDEADPVPPILTSVDPTSSADHLPESAAAALHLGEDRLDLALTTADTPVDAESERTLVAVLEALSAPLSDMSPASGIRIEFARSGPDWVASIRPKLLAEGWPARPSISDEVVDFAVDQGAEIDVVANPELGWLIEIRTPAGRLPTRPRVAPGGHVVEDGPSIDEVTTPRLRPVPTTFEPDPVELRNDIDDDTQGDLHDFDSDEVPTGPIGEHGLDLMAASLGDTARMLMIAISGDGRVVFCNDELAARLGLAVADLLGRPFKMAKGSDRAWDEFGNLFARVIDDGLAQQTLSWPHPETSDQQIRWTVSRSVSRSASHDVRPIYLCFGVDV